MPQTHRTAGRRLLHPEDAWEIYSIHCERMSDDTEHDITRRQLADNDVMAFIEEHTKLREELEDLIHAQVLYARIRMNATWRELSEATGRSTASLQRWVAEDTPAMLRILEEGPLCDSDTLLEDLEYPGDDDPNGQYDYETAVLAALIEARDNAARAPQKLSQGSEAPEAP